MDNEPANKSSSKPSGGYGKHSKTFWIITYIIAAIIVYGIIYLLFIHKGSTGGSSGGFNY